MKTREEKIKEMREYIQDILQCDKYMKVKEYNHHFDTNIFEHCVDVAYYSYIITKSLGLDYKSTVRAGMLHDFFLYNWQEYVPPEGLHGFVHPRIAYRNASEKFELNDKEKDIILKHMFPLTIRFPRYFESAILCLVDKVCATEEVISYIYKITSIFFTKVVKGIMYSSFIYQLLYVFLIFVKVGTI